MKRVLLYKRVSSDEQADKGYSLADQDENLHKHCAAKGKIVLGSFSEDFSAWYDFNRPEWNKIINYIKANRGKVDEILFTKWTRFSRNVPEAYAMIKILKGYGVAINSIEQPLDFSIPESKIMLSLYLSTAEVDNDRRSLNVRDGMRRAKSEGRHIGRASFGYINQRDATDKPIVVIDETKRQIIQDIFNQYLNDTPVPLILQSAREKGYNVRAHGAIQRTVTNHVYGGLIKVPQHRDHAEKVVKGLHEGIVSEEIFWKAYYKVQQERSPQLKTVDDKLPLRGFLICTGCNNLLTGGRSKGKKNYYWYYSCNKCRKQNHSSIQVDKDMTTIMQGLSYKKQAAVTFLHDELNRQFDERMQSNTTQAEALKRQCESMEDKFTSLEKKFIADQISHETYLKWLHTYNKEYQKSKEKLSDISQGYEVQRGKIDRHIHFITDMNWMYSTAKSVMKKQSFLKAIFPPCLTKEQTFYRTPYMLPMFYQNALTLSHLLRVERQESMGMFDNNPFSTPEDTIIEPTDRKI